MCAVKGFSANGVHCGFYPNGGREDFALIYSDQRAATACVYSVGSFHGATALLTQKNLSSGYARAIVANSGVANVAPEGIKLAKSVCLEVSKRTRATETEIVIASTGKIGLPLTLSTYLKGVDGLVKGLSATDEGSKAAARAIMTEDLHPKQMAFSFELGAYPCKIGAIFKGGARVSPNMATTLCFLTTDAAISPKMLQKALNTAVKDTFNMSDIDGTSSPNDTVCIMANGNAGNYKIDYADTEYKKFTDALWETMRQICIALLKDAPRMRKLLLCKVCNAKSKQTARAVAKAVVCSEDLRHNTLNNRLDFEAILGAAYSTGETFVLTKTTLTVSSENGRLVVFEDGKATDFSKEAQERILNGKEIEIIFSLGEGNYSARAYGCVRE